jgi:hypothetical protein
MGAVLVLIALHLAITTLEFVQRFLTNLSFAFVCLVIPVCIICLLNANSSLILSLILIF